MQPPRSDRKGCGRLLHYVNLEDNSVFAFGDTAPAIYLCTLAILVCHLHAPQLVAIESSSETSGFAKRRNTRIACGLGPTTRLGLSPPAA